MNALTRCLRAAREIGIAAVLVDAKHERTKGFYARYEYESLSGRPLTLWLPMASVRRSSGL
jgi:hypothetical protein